MTDMTLCTDVQCPLKEGCYRFQAEPNASHQSYFYKSPRGVFNKWETQDDGKLRLVTFDPGPDAVCQFYLRLT